MPGNDDIVVITGDFVDDDTTREDMVKSSKGLGMLKTKYGVYFIYGNHDKAYFNYRNFNNKQLRKELKKNNVIILEDEVKLINNYIYLVGRQDRLASDRLEAETLTDDLENVIFAHPTVSEMIPEAILDAYKQAIHK